MSVPWADDISDLVRKSRVVSRDSLLGYMEEVVVTAPVHVHYLFSFPSSRILDVGTVLRYSMRDAGAFWFKDKNGKTVCVNNDHLDTLRIS